jgi:hypothetical protein
VLNPGATPASVLLRFLKDDRDGHHSTRSRAGRGATVNHSGDAERPRRRQLLYGHRVGRAGGRRSDDDVGGGHGSHAALTAPSTTWYLAEGSTAGEFNLFYLLQNPNPTAVQATVRYLRPSGQPPAEKRYMLSPNNRTTICVNGKTPRWPTRSCQPSSRATRRSSRSERVQWWRCRLVGRAQMRSRRAWSRRGRWRAMSAVRRVAREDYHPSRLR